MCYLTGRCKIIVVDNRPSNFLTVALFVLGQTVSMDAMVNVVDNKIAAELALNDLGLELKWSDIGNFPVALLQVSLVSTCSEPCLSSF